MTLEEFATHTGYKPSAKEYRGIEESYKNFDGCKDAFYQMWRAEMRNAEYAAGEAINKLLIAEAERHGLYTPRFLKLKEISGKEAA